MKYFIEKLRPFKRLIITCGILFFIYLLFVKIIPAYMDSQAKKTPIISITAKNERVYNQASEISKSDFIVKAKHQNKKTSRLSPNEFNISTRKPNKIGKFTEVTITLKKDSSISTVSKVKNKRDEVTSFDCGNPILKDVKATLYSNGELHFSGKGDVLQWDPGAFPWIEQNEYITSVTFADSVQPLSMDYWFSDLINLEYVDTLPSSVKSIVAMCSNCPSLQQGADWSKCENLLDISYCYSGCTKLKNVPTIPSTVKNATCLCESCEELQVAPDMSQATQLTETIGMFMDCRKLTTTNLTPAAVSMNDMYKNCINLKEMPELPETAMYINSMFEGDFSLATVKRIPANVKEMFSCFSECRKLSGQLIIDANPDSFNGFLWNAANATVLDLTGASTKLNELALTNEQKRITVNGSKPIEEQ